MKTNPWIRCHFENVDFGIFATIHAHAHVLSIFLVFSRISSPFVEISFSSLILLTPSITSFPSSTKNSMEKKYRFPLLLQFDANSTHSMSFLLFYLFYLSQNIFSFPIPRFYLYNFAKFIPKKNSYETWIENIYVF